MKRSPWCVALVGLTLSAAGAAAQDVPAPDRPAADKPAPDRPERGVAVVPLKVQILLTRHAGGQRIASLPYTLTVTAGRREWARLRMGVEVPVITSAGEAATKSVQYRSVGVNLDCMADRLADGRFSLSVTVEQSSVYVSEPEKRGGAPSDAPLGPQPMFRTFKANFNPVLRDGQTELFTVATDPVSGEQSRVEVTLNVLK